MRAGVMIAGCALCMAPGAVVGGRHGCAASSSRRIIGHAPAGLMPGHTGRAVAYVAGQIHPFGGLPHRPAPISLAHGGGGGDATCGIHCVMKHNDLCRSCGAELRQPATGRRRRYCSQRCRQKAYRGRRRLRVALLRGQGQGWFVVHRWADYRRGWPAK